MISVGEVLGGGRPEATLRFLAALIGGSEDVSVTEEDDDRATIASARAAVTSRRSTEPDAL